MTEAIPGALYDPMVPEPTPTPTPAVDYSDKELEDIANELMDGLPGHPGRVRRRGQRRARARRRDLRRRHAAGMGGQQYGAGVVLISSALVDV